MTANTAINLLEDPRTLAAVITASVAFSVAIFSSLIVPIWINRRKEKKSQRNLMRMIYEDISERTLQLESSIPGLSLALIKAESDSKYTPVILHTSGEDYLSLKDEKWLIPSEYSQDIVKFYSHAKGLIDLTNFPNKKAFHSLSRQRQIAVFKKIEERMVEGSIIGSSLSSRIKANGWLKR